MDDKSAISKIKDLTKDLLKKVEIKAEVSAEVQDGEEDKKYLMVKIEGDDLGILVGHHGKILESLQTILGLILSREDDNKYRVVLDINDYRERRAEYLTSMALQAAEQVRQSGQDMELEPMKPNERRVVHMALQEEKGISTESVGEGEERRIVVKKA